MVHISYAGCWRFLPNNQWLPGLTGGSWLLILIQPPVGFGGVHLGSPIKGSPFHHISSFAAKLLQKKFCISTLSQLYLNFISTLSQLYLNFISTSISTLSQLYLNLSQLYLNFISIYLNFISTTSHFCLSHYTLSLHYLYTISTQSQHNINTISTLISTLSQHNINTISTQSQHNLYT